MAGVAAAFDASLVEDQRLRAVLEGNNSSIVEEPSRKLNRQRSPEAAYKMALVPEGACVEWPSDGNPWPLVSMKNVYIFAGMPSVCRTMFERAAKDGRFEG